MYAAKNFYLDAIVNFTNAQYDAERNISYADGIGLVDVDAAGDTKGLTLSGGLSTGYDFLVGGLTVSPNLGFYYIDATIDGFTESGAGGLNLVYDEQNFRSLTGNLGLRLTYAWNLPWGVLLPHLRVDYVHEFEDDVDVFGVRFASDPNATSTAPILIETENPDSSYWRLATGFSAQFTHGISAYIEYQRLESFDLISFQDIRWGCGCRSASDRSRATNGARSQPAARRESVPRRITPLSPSSLESVRGSFHCPGSCVSLHDPRSLCPAPSGSQTPSCRWRSSSR